MSEKSAPKGRIPVDGLPGSTRPWETIGIDVTDPFHTAPSRSRFIVAVVNHFSGFPDLLLSPSHDASVLVGWLTELFARYGNPDCVVSNNVPEFAGNLFTEFLASRDIKHHRTPVYQPQTNGKVDVFNRAIKFHAQTLTTGSFEFEKGMMDLLALFRAERPTPGGTSPAELFLGRHPRLAFEPRRTHDDTQAVEPPARGASGAAAPSTTSVAKAASSTRATLSASDVLPVPHARDIGPTLVF